MKTQCSVPGERRRAIRSWLTVVGCSVLMGSAAGSALRAHAQEIRLGDGAGESAAKRQHVELETAAVEVKAGAPGWVELRFRVDPGMHINSHAPKDELLVPTALVVTPGAVKVMGEDYPAGVSLRLDVGAGEVLSTYQGEFRMRLQVLAPKGDETLNGALKYQACDARSCFPPRSLPVQVTVKAR